MLFVVLRGRYPEEAGSARQSENGPAGTEETIIIQSGEHYDDNHDNYHEINPDPGFDISFNSGNIISSNPYYGYTEDTPEVDFEEAIANDEAGKSGCGDAKICGNWKLGGRDGKGPKS